MRAHLTEVLIAIAVVIVLAAPVSAAPPSQTVVPGFSLTADTTLTVMIVLADGQTVVVPVDVQYVAVQQNGTTQVTTIAGVDQQPGLQIAVTTSGPVTGTLQFTAPTASLIPTVTPPAPTTPQPADSAPVEADIYIALSTANLRSGPGTTYPIVGSVEAGAELMVVGQNEDGAWFQLADGSWIAAFLVSPAGEAAPAPSVPATPAVPIALPTAITLPATPVATTVAAVEATLEQLAASNSELAAALDALADLLAAPRPRSATWRADVLAQATIIVDALEAMGMIPPVPGYEDLQAQVTSTVAVCTTAANYMDTGLENLSPADLLTATQAIAECSSQAAELAATLEQLQP